MSFVSFGSVSEFVVAGLVSALALTGCSSSDAPQKEDVDSYESELRLAGPRYLGQIANGETKTNYYYSPPNTARTASTRRAATRSPPT